MVFRCSTWCYRSKWEPNVCSRLDRVEVATSPCARSTVGRRPGVADPEPHRNPLRYIGVVCAVAALWLYRRFESWWQRVGAVAIVAELADAQDLGFYPRHPRRVVKRIQT